MNERRQLTVGSLFSGIGGFDIGLERAGMRVIWQSEIDPYASAVLRRHWPAVPNLGDVRGITAETVADAFNDGSHRPQWDAPEPSGNGTYDGLSVGNDWRPSVLCGGFPCQDISNAGKRAGIDGERSGLWSEFARIIGELRPRYAIMENVAALLGRGLERVLGDLAALGYDAEWHCIPASAVGAPHRRDRVWIVAYAASANAGSGSGFAKGQESVNGQPSQFLFDSSSRSGAAEAWRDSLADSNGDDGHGRRSDVQMGWGRIAREVADDGRFGNAQWSSEPDVGRVAHGVRNRVDRLRCLGNAIVPQIAEIIGRAIVALDNAS